jgi:dinuclear metal center YbgI/SA1388 family protein
VIFLVLYRTLQNYLEKIAPSYLESDWDNSGPQVTTNQETLEEILIGLDPTTEFIEKGIARESDLLITHHPLIFSELEKLDGGTLTGKKLMDLASYGMDLLAIHTPFDVSARGLSHGLAKRLQLEKLTPLKTSSAPNLLKLSVFVPKTGEEMVKEALVESGAGEVGNYRESYYKSRAEGSFRATESADPSRGEAGETEKTEEVKLEFLLSPKYRRKVVSALHGVHPYEEPGFSLEETERQEPGVGLGRIGEWRDSRGPDEVKSLIAASLEMSRKKIRFTGNLEEKIKRVATSPGAGGPAVNPAIDSEVDLLITGELDYHERTDARERGLAIMEVGHFHSEKVFVPRLKELLREEFSPEALSIELFEGENVE